MEDKPTLKDKIAQSGVWITLVTAGFLVIFFFINAIQAQKQQETLDKQNNNIAALVQQVKTLSEQNNTLSKDNKKLNEQNVRYAYCNAVLLAKYTQTGEAIQIEDLDNCVLTTFSQNQGQDILNGTSSPTSESSNNSQGSGSNTVTQNPPVNNTPNNPSNPSNPNNPPAPNPNPNPNPNTPQQRSGVTINPSLQLDPTFLTPGVNLDGGINAVLPCVGIPHVLRLC